MHVFMDVGSVVVGMGGVVVAEMSAREGRNEQGETCEHQDSFPSVVALSAVGMGFMVSVGTCGFCHAF